VERVLAFGIFIFRSLSGHLTSGTSANVETSDALLVTATDNAQVSETCPVPIEKSGMLHS